MKPFSRPFDGPRGNALIATAMTGAGAGFILFGYDQGVANALQQSTHFYETFPTLKSNTTLLGTTLAMFVLGAFFGCIINSVLGNRFGRRTMFIVAGIGTLIGAILQTVSVNLGMLIFSRIFNGIFVGILTSIVPVHVGELAKPKVRGKLMALELCFAATGLMTSFWVAYAFRKDMSGGAWRWPLAIQAFLIVVSLFALMFTPESPRWLIQAGRVEEGTEVLRKLYDDAYAREATLEIQEAIALEQATHVKGLKAAFANNKQCFRYRTMLCIGMNFFQQATGINTATYYAGNIFIEGIGMEPDKALLALGGLGISGLVFCIFGCLFLIERAGRIGTLQLGTFLQVASMAMLAGGLAHAESKSAGYVAAVGLYLYLSAFSFSWLPAGFMYGAEISALAVRPQAQAIGIAVQFLINFVVVEVSPTAFASIGWKYYLMWCIINACMMPLIYLYFPEPAGLSLEEIDTLFVDGKVTVRRNPRAPVDTTVLETALEHGGPVKREESFAEKASQ